MGREASIVVHSHACQVSIAMPAVPTSLLELPAAILRPWTGGPLTRAIGGALTRAIGGPLTRAIGVMVSPRPRPTPFAPLAHREEQRRP